LNKARRSQAGNETQNGAYWWHATTVSADRHVHHRHGWHIAVPILAGPMTDKRPQGAMAFIAIGPLAPILRRKPQRRDGIGAGIADVGSIAMNVLSEAVMLYRSKWLEAGR
jgi:hypothetical protein